jgi:hypothetical protein
MITPEEIQRTMEFILASQANSVVRMDRLEGNLDRLEGNLGRLEVDLKLQQETVDSLARVTQDLLKVSANVVERTKRLETRAGSVDEMLTILRELMEANLRNPDNPKQDND